MAENCAFEIIKLYQIDGRLDEIYKYDIFFKLTCQQKNLNFVLFAAFEAIFLNFSYLVKIHSP